VSAREAWVAVSGIVEAPPEQVWPALVATSPFVPADQRHTAATEPVTMTVPLVDPTPALDTVGAGRVHLETDPANRRLSMAGEWWYRGVYTVDGHPEGSAVTYAVYNVAPTATRWIVPMIQRGIDARARATLADTLRSLGDYLKRPVRF
jgi:hypothetical protein